MIEVPMKKFTLVFSLFLTTLIPLTVSGIKPVNLYTIVYRYFSYHETEFDPHRRPDPFQCTISKDEGVKIPSVTVEDIERYEIYGPDGGCLGTFTEQEEFITSLFSRNGVFEVRFYMADFVLIGDIEIK